MTEKNVLVKFEGWEIDIFITDDGNLGLTVQNLNDGKEHAKDIFVDKVTLAVKDIGIVA